MSFPVCHFLIPFLNFLCCCVVSFPVSPVFALFFITFMMKSNSEWVLFLIIRRVRKRLPEPHVWQKYPAETSQTFCLFASGRATVECSSGLFTRLRALCLYYALWNVRNLAWLVSHGIICVSVLALVSLVRNSLHILSHCGSCSPGRASETWNFALFSNTTACVYTVIMNDRLQHCLATLPWTGYVAHLLSGWVLSDRLGWNWHISPFHL